MDQASNASPRLKARIAGGFYVVTTLTTIFSHFFAAGTPLGQAAGLLSGATYLVVTCLLFELLRPVNASLSLLAAAFSLVGIAGSGIAFFGVYCVLLGLLIFRSRFLPRILGVLMVPAGCGLLIDAYGPLLWPKLPHILSTVGFTLDGIGEIPFQLWLLLMGVNQPKWREQAGATPIAN